MRCFIFKQVSHFYRKLFRPEHEFEPNSESTSNVTIVPRNQHNVSRKDISENALKVLYRLNKHGYEAYLVGGCVRDLLLGLKPKDFDVTTNATPEQIQKIFRNCRLVGRRFRLAHIMFGKEVIEVATFRGEHAEFEHHNNDDENKTNNQQRNKNISQKSQSGMLLRDNVYGNIEQDALRRDFTINSLYYNAKDFSVRDYCHGLEDLKNGIIRLIGDPETRYREDPVRMLRTIRFAGKLNMTIADETQAPITRLAPLLKNIPSARLFDESLKLLQAGYGFKTYQLLRQYHLFEQLFPIIDHHFVSDKYRTGYLEKMIEQVLKNTDYRITNDQRVNPAFLFSAFLWYPLSERTQQIIVESGLTYHDSFSLAVNDILQEQCRSIAIPRRLTSVMNDIWRLQLRLNKRQGKRAFAVFEHAKFRAAYDLLELRASIEKGELLELAHWWNDFQLVNKDQQADMVKILGTKNSKRRGKSKTSH